LWLIFFIPLAGVGVPRKPFLRRRRVFIRAQAGDHIKAIGRLVSNKSRS